MEDISSNENTLPCEIRRTESLTRGKGIEQCLSRVRMASIPRIDHRHVRHLREVTSKASHRVTHHYILTAHRLQCIDRLLHRLPFLYRGGIDIELRHVCRQTLSRDLERGRGARTVLIEEH